MRLESDSSDNLRRNLTDFASNGVSQRRPLIRGYSAASPFAQVTQALSFEGQLFFTLIRFCLADVIKSSQLALYLGRLNRFPGI
jgi:hypothetical protein